MKYRLDEIVYQFVECDARVARLGRNHNPVTRRRVFAKVLADLESCGDAMRYLNSQGRIAWKATPDLRDYLRDLQLDAEADLANEEA